MKFRSLLLRAVTTLAAEFFLSCCVPASNSLLTAKV